MCKRLTISQKLQIINELSKPNHMTKKSLGDKFGVSEGAIRKTWTNREVIRKRSADLPQNFRSKKKQNSSY